MYLCPECQDCSASSGEASCLIGNLTAPEGMGPCPFQVTWKKTAVVTKKHHRKGRHCYPTAKHWSIGAVAYCEDLWVTITFGLLQPPPMPYLNPPPSYSYPHQRTGRGRIRMQAGSRSFPKLRHLSHACQIQKKQSDSKVELQRNYDPPFWRHPIQERKSNLKCSKKP